MKERKTDPSRPVEKLKRKVSSVSSLSCMPSWFRYRSGLSTKG
jgi:hypothetical protein